MYLSLTKDGCEMLINFFENEMIKYTKALSDIENKNPRTSMEEENINEISHTVTYIDLKIKELKEELTSL